MSSGSADVCLCMIVKDEAQVIERCLRSVRPHISEWLIVDTGSRDATRELIRAALFDVPGELIERPWVDFATNRNEALELARRRSSNVLVIDADEELIVPAGWRWPELTADGYLIELRLAGDPMRYSRVQVVRSALPWRYEGAVHEGLVCDDGTVVEPLRGVSILSHSDGARNEDRSLKFSRDAELLEAVVQRDPTDLRARFYLAQSYRDAGCPADALLHYRQRAASGGWEEEAWYAAFQVGVLLEVTGAPHVEIVAAYLQAYEMRPTRTEPVCALARYFRLQGQHATARIFAAVAADIPMTDDILFVDTSVYDWRALDERSIAEYWTGDYEGSEESCTRLLTEGFLPESETERVIDNRNHARRALGRAGAAP